MCAARAQIVDASGNLQPSMNKGRTHHSLPSVSLENANETNEASTGKGDANGMIAEKKGVISVEGIRRVG